LPRSLVLAHLLARPRGALCLPARVAALVVLAHLLAGRTQCGSAVGGAGCGCGHGGA